MKNIANRVIVIAAGTLALGTVAFGQTRMTAEVPFAFRTVSGVLPAGTYQIEPRSVVSGASLVTLRNVATSKAVIAGHSQVNNYSRADGHPLVEFVCRKDGCALKAIRMNQYSLEYATPSKGKKAEVAVISVPLKALSTD